MQSKQLQAHSPPHGQQVTVDAAVVGEGNAANPVTLNVQDCQSTASPASAHAEANASQCSSAETKRSSQPANNGHLLTKASPVDLVRPILQHGRKQPWTILSDSDNVPDGGVIHSLDSSTYTFSDNCSDLYDVKRHRKHELDISRWDHCEQQQVARLPYDIDGLAMFTLECKRDELMTCTKDGRPWKTWVESSRKGHKGIRRVARCKGSPMCSSSECPFLENGNGPNRTQFTASTVCLECFTCGTPAEEVPCNAVKVIEYEESKSCVTVMHIGNHTCIAKQPKINRAVILKAVAQNPGVKPNKLINDHMVQMMTKENFDWNEIENIASAFADKKRLHNARAEILQKNNPLGQNFEALGEFKKKCDERDKYLIYRINCRNLNGQPSYVFKSSLAMAKLALSMDRNSSGTMHREYAHVDAMHDRCRALKTLTLWAYHEMSRKLVCLAVMDVESETTENLKTFWNLLNGMLQDVSGDIDYKFNPTGFIADEHHANWRSINEVFGAAAVDRTVSCEFHFKQSVHRQARRMVTDSVEFITLCDAMLRALTEHEFDQKCMEIEKLLTRHTHLCSWFRWWMDRKAHIFAAFKPLDAPTTNLAEVGHSKLSSVGRRHMSLLEAAREDVALAIRQETELHSFTTGEAGGGRGVSVMDRRANTHKAQMKRAAAYGREIKLSILPAKRPATFIQTSGVHRPLEVMKPAIINGRHCTSKAVGKGAQQPTRPLHAATKPSVRRAKRVLKNCIAIKSLKKKAKHTTHSPAADRPSVAVLPKKTSDSTLKFNVVQLTLLPTVQVCYGCGSKFTMKYRKPPHDLILRTYCNRRYTDKSGLQKVSSKLTAAYCHLKMTCVQKIQPSVQVNPSATF